MFATITGSVPVVRLLLESGANVDKTNNVNRTAAQMGGFVGNNDNNNNKLESNYMYTCSKQKCYFKLKINQLSKGVIITNF